MDLFLGSQFCSIDHCVFFCANTLLFQLVYIYTILCNQEAWYLQFCSFSRLFRLFRVFRGSMPILELFVLILWICHWNVDRYCFESIDCFKYSGYFNNINYSYLWTWNVFPICVFSNFFHKYLYNFQCIVFTSFVKFIPRYFILFDAIVNGIVFLIYISDSLLLVYRSTRYLYFCILWPYKIY